MVAVIILTVFYMIVISLESKKKNSAAEFLRINSFACLPVLSESLAFYQHKNFFDLPVGRFFLLTDDGVACTSDKIFHTVCPKELEKFVFNAEEEEPVLVYKNNFYFDCSFSNILNNHLKTDEDVTLIRGENSDSAFAVLYKLRELKRELSVSGDAIECFENIFRNSHTSVTASGYVKEINSVFDYKELLGDLINLKTSLKPPCVAEGVYASESVPKGDFIIIPPVFFDEGVQIEKGAVIGPNTVIMGNSLISSDTHIADSVIMNGVYISSDCYVESSVCCSDVSVRRSSAVFSGSVLGYNSVIDEDCSIESGSLIRPYVRVELNVKSPFDSKIFESGTEFQGLLPEKAALLGSALGAVFPKASVCIASDGEANSQALKLAVISGLMSTGADCVDIGSIYNSAVLFSMSFCELDFGIFISGKGGGTDIKIYEKNAKPLSRSNYFNIISAANSGDIKRCSYGECKTVHQMKGLSNMYVREISGWFTSTLKYFPVFSSTNSRILKITEDIVRKIGVNDLYKCEINFFINEEGTNLLCEYGREKIPHRKLFAAVLKNEVENTEFVSMMLRNFRDDNSESSCEIINKLWQYDAVFLAFKILLILNNCEENLSELIKALPEFYVAEKVVDLPLRSGNLSKKLGKLGKQIKSRNGELEISGESEFLTLRKNRQNNAVRLVAKAFSAEAAEELLAEIEQIIGEK